MKQTLIAACAMLTAMLGQASPLLADDSLTIAMDGASPPYNFTGSDGKLTGLEVELSSDLCARLKMKCVIVSQAWEGIIPSLLAKRYDVIMSGFAITPERQKQVDFTVPYSIVPTWFVGPKSEFANVNTIEDVTKALKGKSIGVLRAGISQKYAESTFKDGTQVKPYDNDNNIKIDLLAGRIDAALHVSVNLALLLSSPDGKDFTRFGPEIYSNGGFAIGLRKDGTVKTLNEKWLHFDATPKKPS
jgi:octopine/nopaline transport system substrate-binding protein